MPTPPTTYPRWSTDQSNMDAPSAGQMDTGWTPGQMGVSDYDNYIKFHSYQWISYLGKRLYQPDIIDHMLPAIGFSGTDNVYYPEISRKAIKPTLSYPYAIAPHAGMAYLKQGSANNKVKIAPGVLLQKTTSGVLAYYFDGTTEVTIANGNTVNPRLDLIQMQISADANQNPTVTVSVKQGTPAASPAPPTPDAGYCILGLVMTSASYTGTSAFGQDETSGANNGNYWDMRMPLHSRAYRCNVKDLHVGANWTLQNDALRGMPQYYQAGAAAGDLIAFFPGGRWQRFLGVEIGLKTTAGVGELGVITSDPAVGYSYNKLTTTGGWGSTTYSVYLYHNPAAWPHSIGTGVVATNTSWTFEGSDAVDIRPPIWTNGSRALRTWQDDRTLASGNPPSENRLVFLVTGAPSGTQITHITFYVAGDL